LFHLLLVVIPLVLRVAHSIFRFIHPQLIFQLVIFLRRNFLVVRIRILEKLLPPFIALFGILRLVLQRISSFCMEFVQALLLELLELGYRVPVCFPLLFLVEGRLRKGQILVVHLFLNWAFIVLFAECSSATLVITKHIICKLLR